MAKSVITKRGNRVLYHSPISAACHYCVSSRFSYLYEAFDSYQSADRPKDAMRALKYMLLSKIMMNNTSVCTCTNLHA